jgi:hypothetical protein
MYPLIVAVQWLGKNVGVAMNIHTKTEKLLPVYCIAWHKIPEGSNLHISYHVNFKSHIPSGLLTLLNYRRGIDLTELATNQNHFKTIPSVHSSKILVPIWQDVWCHNPEAHNKNHYQDNHNSHIKN